MRTLCLIGCLLIATSGCPSDARAQAEADYGLLRVKVRLGDDPRWAAPDWDDETWQDFETWYYSPASDTTALFWWRFTGDITETPAPGERKGIAVSVIAAFDLYWDGRLIGQSGRVGTSLATEVPGPLDNLFLIPDSLYTPGTHTVALRLSNFYVQRRFMRYLHGIDLGDYLAMARRPLRRFMLPLLFLGGFLIIGIYYLLLYLVATRQRADLLFSLLCFSVSVLLVAESWRRVVGYTYDWHFTRLWIVLAATAASGVLLLSFFMVQFAFPKKRYGLALLGLSLALSVLLPRSYDMKSALMFVSMLSLSALVTGWAVAKKKEGSWFALAGMALCLVLFYVDGYQFLDRFFFLAFGGLIVCLLASLSLQRRKQREAHERALVNAARLEIELLKKNIQPHFLMNALTSVTAWIEENPATGVKLIEALADEFRILSEVSDKKLIPMAQELALCRSHLAIMSHRTDITFALDVEGVHYEESVPPALFHTLVENGITHNAYDTDAVRFHLRAEDTPDGRRYTLITPTGGVPPANGYAEGTGLRYVKARLEESFGTRWRLTSTPAEDGWKTVIDLYRAV